MESNKMIFITTQRELIHNYPEAPDVVSYLKNKHRHIFHFKVYILVDLEVDRELEFIMFKHFIESFLPNNGTDIGSTSCEVLANKLYDNIHDYYPNRRIKIEISEDNENGIIANYS